MRTKIITDSTADLPRDILLRYDIGVTPLYIIKDGAEYRDSVTITPADIFRHVEEGGALCTTAAVSEYDYRQIFSQYAHRCDAVIQITIGSGFSSCYQNACEASQGFENVFVVNSENLSTGQGHVVLAAARMAEKGLPAPEIVSALNALVPRVEASFLLDRLDYMKKGGRCSAVTALGANMLHIKPCIEVKGGKMMIAGSKPIVSSWEIKFMICTSIAAGIYPSSWPCVSAAAFAPIMSISSAEKRSCKYKPMGATLMTPPQPLSAPIGSVRNA